MPYVMPKDLSISTVGNAIRSLEKGSMMPWFHSKKTPDEWASGLDPQGCAEARWLVCRAMIDSKKNGKHNLAGDLLTLLAAVDARVISPDSKERKG